MTRNKPSSGACRGDSNEIGTNIMARPARWVWISRFEQHRPAAARYPRHQHWMQAHTHQHAFREVMVVLKGCGPQGVGGCIYRAAPGTVFLFDEGEPHDFGYSAEHTDSRQLWLHVIGPQRITANEVVIRNGRLWADKSATCFMPLQGPFIECLTEYWNACAAGDRSPLAMARLKTVTILVFLQAWIERTHAVDNGSVSGHGKSVVTQIRAYIAGHLNEDLSLRNLAHMAGYEAVYFDRLFHKYTNESLRRHINRLRLESAGKLLAQGMTAKATAEQLGFGSSAYFCRFFKTATGLTPTAWANAKKRRA
ncbi:MAG: AraC family transcriptional regulator [Kiritimatiellaeota bacterium]|nr:AraC family transcriptional regulator [Kiritimatiellota bacterium]